MFFHETGAILGSYVMQQQGSRWNLTFILTDSLYGYAMEAYAKGEVQRLRCWRATRGCSPFGAVYAHIYMHRANSPFAILLKLLFVSQLLSSSLAPAGDLS